MHCYDCAAHKAERRGRWKISSSPKWALRPSSATIRPSSSNKWRASTSRHPTRSTLPPRRSALITWPIWLRSLKNVIRSWGIAGLRASSIERWPARNMDSNLLIVSLLLEFYEIDTESILYINKSFPRFLDWFLMSILYYIVLTLWLNL